MPIEHSDQPSPCIRISLSVLNIGEAVLYDDASSKTQANPNFQFSLSVRSGSLFTQTVTHIYEFSCHAILLSNMFLTQLT